MSRLVLDLEHIEGIRGQCHGIGERISAEAANMRAQIDGLYEALQGFPQIGVAEDLADLHRLLSQIPDQVAQADAYMNQIVQAAEDFAGRIGQR